MAGKQPNGELTVLPKKKTAREAREPARYKVLLHNDDFTTMEFVVHVLMEVFQHDETRAMEIMLHVHRNGIGVAGVYPHEIAETRVDQVHRMARLHDFPLRCSIEEA